MTDDQLLERADILPKAPDARLPLDGDFYVRLIRSLRAVLSYNPEQITGSGPRLKLGDQLNYEALMLDASQPPFRVNGRACSLVVNQGVAGGAGNQWVLEWQNNSQDGRILVVDYVLKDGNAALSVGMTVGAPAPDGTGTALNTFELETEPLSSRVPTGTINSKALVQGFTGFTRTENPPAYARLVLMPAVAGQFPVGLVVYPGEQIIFVQETANITQTLTAVGRIWRFGSLTTGIAGLP